ncbi:hypothetical protein LG3211_1921 [Lysobacter gummosus]|nr:hypothetical protein LG3211_1921 [Lysobacter gummosus]
MPFCRRAPMCDVAAPSEIDLNRSKFSLSNRDAAFSSPFISKK